MSILFPTHRSLYKSYPFFTLLSHFSFSLYCPPIYSLLTLLSLSFFTFLSYFFSLFFTLHSLQFSLCASFPTFLHYFLFSFFQSSFLPSLPPLLCLSFYHVTFLLYFFFLFLLFFIGLLKPLYLIPHCPFSLHYLFLQLSLSIFSLTFSLHFLSPISNSIFLCTFSTFSYSTFSLHFLNILLFQISHSTFSIHFLSPLSLQFLSLFFSFYFLTPLLNLTFSRSIFYLSFSVLTHKV